jgi:hypothetical protein
MHLKKYLLNVPNLTIRHENIFESDVSDATRIYVFLLSHSTNRFFAGKDFPGVRVVSRAFSIVDRTPIETIRLQPEEDKFNKHVAYVYEL